MKRLVIILLISFFVPVTLFAQDIITKKDGTDIQAKIIEVSNTEIRYKKYNYQEGPTFVLSKSDILIIRYENGENEVVEDKVSKQEENSQNSVSKNIVAGMSYREYKKLYDTRNYVPERSDPYSRGWAGFASLIIPGLGQGIDGEWGRGLLFMLGNIGSYLMMSGSLAIDSNGNIVVVNEGTYLLGWIAGITLNTWSVCDAVHVAKVKNMYYQDLRKQRTALDFRVDPFLTYMPASSTSPNSLKPAAGLSLKLSF